jgi:phosphoglucosamine mutase
MSTTRKYFGTDGIRGEVGKPPITPDFILKLGWAAGKVLAAEGRGKVLIGKDTRISGYVFESVLEAGFASAGVDVRLLGPMPTPAIAYLTRTLHARAGVVISASHNPYNDNGIKFFSSAGTKLPDSVEIAIEAQLEEPLLCVSSSELGKVARLEDAAGRYIEFCKSTIPFEMNLNGMRIVVDCAHGATYHVAPAVLEELGAEVISIGVNPNGLNINDAVGAVAPDALCQAVLDARANLGIGLDGDGDRLVMVDHLGEVLDGDDILLILAQDRHRNGQLSGPVVGTLMSNLGLQEALQKQGIEMCRAKVGDRHVVEMMAQHGSTLGGETSGHIICRDRVTSGDGIVSALQVLCALRDSGKNLNEIKSSMQKYPQVLVNVRLPKPMDVLDVPAVRKAVEMAQAKLDSEGRVLLRSSGTEPVVRVMVEGRELEMVQSMANDLAAEVSTAIEKHT